MGGNGASSKKNKGGGGSTQITREDRLNASGEFQYHTTTASAIPGIYQSGLQPNRGMFGKGVYMSETESASRNWAETTTGGNKTLRVKTAYLRDHTDYDIMDDTQGFTSRKIPTKQIEIKSNGKWMSLNKYAKKYKRSFKMAGVNVKD